MAKRAPTTEAKPLNRSRSTAADIEDFKLFPKTNKANRIAFKSNDPHPGDDHRSPECVEFLKQADIDFNNHVPTSTN